MSDLMFCAEIGSNWFGSIDVAKYLHEKAKWAGATHVKYQLWKCDDLYKPDWKYYEHAKLCELSYDTARILKKHAESIGLGWFASVHTKEDIDFLVDVKAPYIKIKGSQCEDWNLINYAQKEIDYTNVIISYPDWKDYRWRNSKGLYTTPKYPSKFEDIDFKILDNNETCKGFSDHTQGIQASLCAAMYPNIRIFERHFTDILRNFQIDETKTPDYCVSIYPGEFKKMVERIKHIKGE